jgi:signal peptidase I
MPDDQATDDQPDSGVPGPASGPDPAPAAGSPPGKQRKFWRQLLIIVVTAIAVTLLVKAFVVQPYKIPSQSMENTLLPGDRVLVNRLVYHFRGIARGDIVVFSGQGSWGNLEGEPDSLPANPVVRVVDDVLSDIGLYSNQTFYIKRVIGLPGDRVACCTDGRVTVNGVPLHETAYLFPGAAPATRTFKVTVPAGRLWVMGDNREDSDDSLDHMLAGFPDQGTIPEHAVVGRAFLIIWPLSRLGDLPIPATFKQAALNTGTGTGAAALLGAPLLAFWKRRRRGVPRDVTDRKLVGYWDKHAGRYDHEMDFWDRHLFGSSRPWACGRATGDVLEVAIGTGRNLPYYPDGIRLTGVDLSAQMLGIARDRAAGLRREAALQPGDAQALDFPDGSFDTVLCTLGLCAIPDDRRAIREMARVLRPGGCLVLVDHIAARSVALRVLQWLYERITIPLAGEHFRRRPLTQVRELGFRVEEVERFRFGIVERLAARKPEP